MKNIFKLTVIAVLAITLSNCKKDTVNAPEPELVAPAPTTTGSLSILFEAMVDTNALVLGTQTYTNQAGNLFNITAYKYYISNIKITKMDNSIWTETNSYHLIDHSDNASTLVTIPNVPFGNYKAIEFVIGVDSASNRSAGTGALDPANGMCWGWNQGYIMAKLEGTTSSQNIRWHVGGWNAAVAPNVIKTVAPSFNGDTAKVTSTFSPEIHMSNNLLEWFATPNTIDLTTFPKVIMSPGNDAKTIADNYADMFTVEHIHN
jgi:hypothetical protein